MITLILGLAMLSALALGMIASLVSPTKKDVIKTSFTCPDCMQPYTFVGFYDSDINVKCTCGCSFKPTAPQPPKGA
jgi:hypothetical protein